MMTSQDSNRLYSWLWDSHISPRNSKWLQENLSDIDSTVKQMIKIIEEDGDSFARRAEMYYKRRPELMRLVEQFYRAYRGLAERYSHATGVIRQAHHTMAEAFPDQVPPLLLTDECHHTTSSRVVNVTEEHCGWDEGTNGFKESAVDGNENGLKRSELFQFGNFAEEEGLTLGGSDGLASVANALVLKGCVGNSEGEKEGGFFGLQMILERLSALESRVACAEEESRRLKEQATKTGAEVDLLNEALRRSEAEKEAVVVQYKQCIERISSLEGELSREPGDETEAKIQVQTLKNVLASSEEEKDTILAQHTQCATMISTLQKKLLIAEDEAKRISERADKADDEVEWLKKEIAKLVEEKEVASLVYWQSIGKISSLENEFSSTQDEVLRLHSEINSATYKLQGAEERYLLLERSKNHLQSEMQSLTHQLLDKQTEFGEVWTRVQEEHSRYVEAETALQKLQLVHSECLDELRFVTSQLFSKEELLKECELRNVSLEDEIVKMNKAMEGLREQNLSSELAMEYLKSVNEELRVKIVKLGEEVEDLKEKHRQTLENNELLGLEKSVLVMLFGQLRTESAEAEKERKALLENLNSKSQKLTALRNEAENLLTKNDMLKQKVNEKSGRVKKLENDIQGLNSKLSEVQDSYRELEMQNAKLLQENTSLRKDFSELKNRNRALEDENCMVLIEALSLGNISLVFKNFVTEKNIEVEGLATAASNGKELLRERESQLRQAEQNLLDTQKQKALLEDAAVAMKKDFNKARESQEAQILRLSSDNEREIANNTFLHKMVKQLDAELVTLREQYEETKAREMALSSELGNKRNEIKELFSKVLISSVEEAVFIEKANELTEKCRSLEAQRVSESGDVRVLREKVCDLEGENVGLKAQLDALVAAIDSLRNDVLSLERHTGNTFKSAEKSKEGRLDCNLRGDGTGGHDAPFFGELAKVQDLQNRMKVLENFIEDMGRPRTPENLATEIKCEVLWDDGLPSQCDRSDLTSPQSDEGIKKDHADESFVDSDTPKDITLDKASKIENYGSSRRDERMLELWEIGSEGQSIDLTVSKDLKAGNTNSISEIMVVDEGLEVVDKLEVSKRFIDSYQEENKRKMLEKLESDGLKITNLQITVQDLMAKVSITEKTKKKDHDIEYNTVKEQLEEAEEAVTKLSEMNTKLKKAVQDTDHISSDKKSQSEFEHAWNLRRRKILDHANRGAERLARLQLEVQKLQFLLLKLDNEQEKKPKARIIDSGPKFLLKDYLQGRARSVRLNGVNQSKKKIFCGCIIPPDNGDSPRYKKN